MSFQRKDNLNLITKADIEEELKRRMEREKKRQVEKLDSFTAGELKEWIASLENNV